MTRIGPLGERAGYQLKSPFSNSAAGLSTRSANEGVKRKMAAPAAARPN